jgi:pseudouridine synthase
MVVEDSESGSRLVRLQKFIADCGETSRRKAEVLISEGKVRVNNRIVTEPGTKVDPQRDQVMVGKKLLRLPHKGVLLLYKPRGVVSTLEDPEGRPTVADFLTKKYTSYFPVGRLDWDSSGLMIMTNDGELAERLMHPRYGYKRTYHVRVEGRVNEQEFAQIEKGIRLKDGMVSAEASFLSGDEKSTWLEIVVQEGRNRLVRRMMEALRHPVMKLRRVAYGPFKLGKMQSGEIRPLSEREYDRLRTHVLGGGEKKKKPAREPRVRARLISDTGSPRERRSIKRKPRGGKR